MERVYTCDFGETVLGILKEYTGKELRLMISGGSILQFFTPEEIRCFDTRMWSIYYADERLESKELNYTTSRDFLEATDAKVFPIITNIPPKSSAEDYEKVCRYVDIAILGIGEDGHIASLFPNSPALTCKDYFVPVYGTPKPPNTRVTATPQFFNRCVSRLIFLIPPKDGKLKDVVEPHKSIKGVLSCKYTVYIDARKKK